MTLPRLLGSIALVACTAPEPPDVPEDPAVEPPPAPVTETGTTATVPAFYGRVPSNLLVISIDTFRKDHAGKYAPGTMPFLEQIMNEGFTLDNHMECANWTMMGTACSVNGRHNEENGFIPELGLLRAPLPNGPTLASGLADAGYYTILGTGNSWFSSEWNNAQGYTESMLLGGSATSISGNATGLLTNAMLRGDVEDKWMLHMHIMEPHPPYAPPEEYLLGEEKLAPLPGDWDLSDKTEHYEANATWPTLEPDEQAALEAHMRFRYQAELTWLDDQLASIWADLDSKGLLEDTLVVFFNDHGEQIWDHGEQSHAWGLYAEENDGIFVLWSKSIVPGAWTGPTSQIDIAPTLLGLLGADIAPEMTGIPLGEAPEDRATFALTSARQGTVQAVRQDGFKLIYNWDFGTVELYDLAADPLEQTNVYSATDPVALKLWALLLPHIALAQPIIYDDVPVWPAGLPQP